MNGCSFKVVNANGKTITRGKRVPSVLPEVGPNTNNNERRVKPSRVKLRVYPLFIYELSDPC